MRHLLYGITNCFFLLVPAAILSVIAMALNAGAESLWLSLPRMAVMTAGYLAYFAIFIGLALTVSARASSSRVALIVLLGFWFINSLVASRLVTDVAKAAYPTPTAVEFNKAIADEIRGHGEWEENVEKKKKQLMAEYKVTDAKYLPVHPEAVVLDEGEQIDTQVNDKHFIRLHDIYASQQRVYQFGGFWCNFSREGRLGLFSTSPYAASTASHTCGIIAPGLVIPDVSNCPFLILFANSIPLNVTSAFPNVLNPSIG